MRPNPRALVGIVIIGLASAALTATSAAGQSPAALVATVAGLPAPVSGAEVYPRPADGTFDLTGGGFGHGIGMSQYGAQGAALKGLTHAQILAFYYPGTALVPSSPTSVRIGLTSDYDGVVRIGARPGLAVTIGTTTTTLPTAQQWRVTATGTTASTCKVESYNGTAWAVFRAGATPCPATFSAPEGTVDLYLPSGERRVYRGTITAHHRGTTSLATINTTTMQNYLRGVVPSEMPPSWQAQALRSQTVAARTFAARKTNGTSYYDTCDTTSCQVYKGSGARRADGSVSSYEYSATNAAIDATVGQVLTFRFSDGVTRLATTMYSSSNGGQAAAAGGSHTYLPAHSDPYDAVSGNGRHAWTATLPVTSLEARYGIYRVERLQILSRDGAGRWGGRVLTVRVEGYTSSGAYTYATTSGNGLLAARPWPTYSTGIASNYFTIAPSSTVARVATGTIYEVAATFATKNWSAGVPVVYVANGGSSTDQLIAAARAAYNGGPLLLTASTTIPTATRDAMTRLRPGRVVVIGGTTVVSATVAETLRGLTVNKELQRVAGTTVYGTAALLSTYWAAGQPVAYVAAGDSYGDAVSGAALAGRDRAPILLTAKGSLPAATTTELKRLRPARIVVLGGTSTVSAAVASALVPLATSRVVTRLGGADRYASSALVAAQFSSAGRVHLAPGATFQQGLAAAALAGRLGQPVLLTTPTALPSSIQTQLKRLRPSLVDVLGSTSDISDTVLAQVRTAIS